MPEKGAYMKYKNWIRRGHFVSAEEVSLANFGDGTTKNDLKAWKKKTEEDDYYINNLDEAVSLVEDCINRGMKITILGDYDADGETSSVILAKGLKVCGAKDIQIIIPDRLTEGYGTKAFHIDRISGDNVLCIFVDNGISCLDAVNRAKERGFATVVLDHHLAGDTVPDADVIVDPEAEESMYGFQLSDFNGYCGAGLAYRLIRKLCHDDKEVLRKLRPLAGIGTICDVMPLREENFVLAKKTLEDMESVKNCTTGLYAITSALHLADGHLTAKDIGFSQGPVINAQSRLHGAAGAYSAVKQLMYDGPYEKALDSAERLVAVNEERKLEKREGLRLAHKSIKEDGLEEDRPLVVYVPGVGDGIIGIIAGNLCEEYHVPAIVLTDSEGGIVKGSGRSYGNYNMKLELDKISNTLLGYGGHPGAAGLSLEKDKVDDFRNALKDSFPANYKALDSDTIQYDLEIDADDVPAEADLIDTLGPFGEGHNEIVYRINNFQLLPSPKYINLLQNGESFRIKDKATAAFGFGLAKYLPENEPVALDIIGILSHSYFRGVKQTKVEILDFKVSEEKSYIETPFAKMLRES